MANEQKFKTGDVVTLKSGGTKMTVLKSELCIVTLNILKMTYLKIQALTKIC